MTMIQMNLRVNNSWAGRRLTVFAVCSPQPVQLMELAYHPFEPAAYDDRALHRIRFHREYVLQFARPPSVARRGFPPGSAWPTGGRRPPGSAPRASGHSPAPGE